MDENLWPRSIYPSIGKTKRPQTLDAQNISVNEVPVVIVPIFALPVSSIY
ncbi:MAG: hypothetical protein ACI9C4_002020 [Paraglaciecola sp.]|jgi:hypothetical protein